MNRSITRGAILLALIGAWVHRSPAQAPYTIEWQHCYGGSGAEGVLGVDNSPDGGYILAGHTQFYTQAGPDGDVSNPPHNGASDIWVVKISATGQLEWEHCYGGSDTEGSRAVRSTSDGGYIVVGPTSSSNGDVSGCPGTNNSPGFSAFWVLKLAADGTLEWQRCLGGSQTELPQSVMETVYGGFLVGGYTTSNDGDVSGNAGGRDAWLVKLANDGSLDWQLCLGGLGNEVINDIVHATNDGFFAVGASNSNNPSSIPGVYLDDDIWVLKLDNYGQIEWESFFGGSGRDIGRAIRMTEDGGCIIAGMTNSTDGHMECALGLNDIWIARIAPDGTLLWSNCYGGSGFDSPDDLEITEHGTILVSGKTFSMDGQVSGCLGNGDGWLLEVDGGGVVLWQRCMGGSGDDAFQVLSSPQHDGSFLVAGGTGSMDGDLAGLGCNNDMWVVKLSPLTTGRPRLEPSLALTLFPNPTTSTLHIQWSGPAPSTLEVLDATGRLVYGPVVPGTMGEAGYLLPVGALPAGLYAVRLQSATGSSVQRFVKE
jgi:hypothetical protein